MLGLYLAAAVTYSDIRQCEYIVAKNPGKKRPDFVSLATVSKPSLGSRFPWTLPPTSRFEMGLNYRRPARSQSYRSR